MDEIANRIMSAIYDMAKPKVSAGDYIDADGFLVCAKCHTRKQGDVDAFREINNGEPLRVPIPCECRQAELDAQKKAFEKKQKQMHIDRLRRDGIPDRIYQQYTFAADDRRNPAISDACKKYVKHWSEMVDKNTGILLCGNVGTGKSYYACCIANALIEMGVSAHVTNFPRILNRLQGAWGEDREDYIDRLQGYALLVLDDLGTERDTSYSVEQIYNIVDARVRSGRPLIVTTNLSLDDLEKSDKLAHRRIYDRVLEMCPIRIEVPGQSRRKENAEERVVAARELFLKKED